MDALFAEWIGRRSEAEDIVTPRLIDSYRAIFGGRLTPVADDEAPLGIHWCLSPETVAMDDLGADGHPAKGHHLPPIPRPRRMWAGGTLENLQPIRVGDKVRRISTIADVTRKQGRTGELWFVAVDRDYVTSRGLSIRERQDIVYRGAGASGAPANPAPGASAGEPASGEWVVQTPATLLFRYSAITFNGHRIHYDLPYARDVEGYPDLVVHGPLQASLLLNYAAIDLGRSPRLFSYRGLAPAFAGSPIHVRRSPLQPNAYRTEGPAGTLHMEASIETREQRVRQ